MWGTANSHPRRGASRLAGPPHVVGRLGGEAREIGSHGMVAAVDVHELPGRHVHVVRQHCHDVDGYIATSMYYADFMADYLALPRARMHVVYPGLNLAGHGVPKPERNGMPVTVGYFARICPEKGLHLLAEALHLLHETPGIPAFRALAGGVRLPGDS